MKNEFKEQGTYYHRGPKLKDDGSTLRGAVRKALAEHQRLLKGVVQRTKAAGGRFAATMSGKRTTKLEDGTVITTWVNPHGLGQTLLARVTLPAIPLMEEILDCLLGFRYVKAGIAYFLDMDEVEEGKTAHLTGNRTWYSATSNVFLSWNGGPRNYRYTGWSGGANIFHMGKVVATAPVYVFGVGYNAVEGLLYVATNDFESVTVYKAEANLKDCVFTVNDASWEKIGTTDWPDKVSNDHIGTIMAFNASGTSLTFTTTLYNRCKDLVEVAVTPTTLVATTTLQSTWIYTIPNTEIRTQSEASSKTWSTTCDGNIHSYSIQSQYAVDYTFKLNAGLPEIRAYTASDYIGDDLVYAYMTGGLVTAHFGWSWSALAGTGMWSHTSEGADYETFPSTECTYMLKFASAVDLPNIVTQGVGPALLRRSWKTYDYPAPYPATGPAWAWTGHSGEGWRVRAGKFDLEIMDLREGMLVYNTERETYEANGSTTTYDKKTYVKYIVHNQGSMVELTTNTYDQGTVPGATSPYSFPLSIPNYYCADEGQPCPPGSSINGGCSSSSPPNTTLTPGARRCAAIGSIGCPSITSASTFIYAGLPQKSSSILIGTYYAGAVYTTHQSVILNGIEVNITGTIQDPTVIGSPLAFL